MNISTNSSLPPRHYNNFDFLRLLFAIFVLITHSYALLGFSENDWLNKLTNQTSLSQIGVSGFFAISGYLILISLIRSKSLVEYFVKRFIRIFPALIVLLIVTVFIVSPILVEGNVLDHFTNKTTWEYFFQNLLLQSRYNIVGLFENNPYPNAVNGSLWTIPYEFSCYLLLSFFYILKNKVSILRVCMSFAMILFLIIYYNFLSAFSIWTPFFKINTELLLKFGGFFLMGSLLASYSEVVTRYKSPLLIISSIIVIASLSYKFYDQIVYITLPVLVISFGLHSFKYINRVSKVGDFSYGFYLYAFLIQQIIVQLAKPSLTELMVVSFLVTLIFAMASWYLIEKPALNLKRLFKN
jgi:peptidoglycan/LPS O-acetylase OafA/YrhL